MLSYCKQLSWKHRYLLPRHCFLQHTATLSRYRQLTREEIEKSCLTLVEACFQASSGKNISGWLGLQLKEKQMWELSSRHQIFASFPVGRELGIAHMCLSPAAACHQRMSFDLLYTTGFWAPLCSTQPVPAVFTAALRGRWWLGRETRREGESWRGENKGISWWPPRVLTMGSVWALVVYGSDIASIES